MPGRSLIDRDTLGASKHLEDCQVCIDAAGAEVVPFQFVSHPPPDRPAP